MKEDLPSLPSLGKILRDASMVPLDNPKPESKPNKPECKSYNPSSIKKICLILERIEGNGEIEIFDERVICEYYREKRTFGIFSRKRRYGVCDIFEPAEGLNLFGKPRCQYSKEEYVE